MQRTKREDSYSSAVFAGNPTNSCTPDFLTRQARLTPEALAVSVGSTRLTYADLDRRSNQLANYLCSLGVVPDSVIAVCLERSIDFLIAALAIMKAGAAYLPLEPKTPAARLQTMLSAATVPLTLTTSKATESLSGSGTKLLALDRYAEEISRCSGDAPRVSVAPEQLAYVIYTSGSTGMPKAVAVAHDSLLNLCNWHNRVFAVTPADRATQLSSIAFDAAVWELWPHLIAGASVHLVDDETRTQPEQLRDWLVREKITISFVATPIAERMLELAWPRETALRFLLTGADTLRHYPPADLPFTLVNNYGPTECAVVAASASIFSKESPASQTSPEQMPPIGKAIDNAEIYILDSHMQPVPAGATGEIYIGGAGLARGYLNDPALTAQRFVKHPFSSSAGARLYRTGDLGSYLPDGQIAFHGRIDDQVKIRGYRIELNEISSALKRNPALRDCVVVARANDAGEKQLVAYVVPGNNSPAQSDLRAFLSKELPEYMLPASFVMMNALPLAPSGKVDRSALPDPAKETQSQEQISLMPQSPIEQRVAAIVASLLGLKRVGLEDNFFYLGGNSLFGTQVIARLRDAFNVEIPLLKLFDHPTVEALAAEVQRVMIANLDSMSEEEAQRLLALHTQQANL